MSRVQDIVTIDGPAGVGKSTISRRVAAALKFTYLDTGAMYRAVALFLHRQETPLDDSDSLAAAMDKLDLKLLPAPDENSDVTVLLMGEDVSDAIRTPEMGMAASAVSKLGIVRERLTRMQQEIGRNGGIVAEGRDTGTVVFPEAAHKFFLVATPEERARRRVLQLRAKGEEADEEKILAMTIERDRNDREREIAPLVQAEDAVAIDTTELTIDEVCGKLLQAVRSCPSEC